MALLFKKMIVVTREPAYDGMERIVTAATT